MLQCAYGFFRLLWLCLRIETINYGAKANERNRKMPDLPTANITGGMF